MKFILIIIFGYRLLIDVIERKRLILKCSSRGPEVMVHAAEKSNISGGMPITVPTISVFSCQ